MDIRNHWFLQYTVHKQKLRFNFVSRCSSYAFTHILEILQSQAFVIDILWCLDRKLHGSTYEGTTIGRVDTRNDAVTCGIEDGCYAGPWVVGIWQMWPLQCDLQCVLPSSHACDCDLLVDMGTGGYTSTTESNIIWVRVDQCFFFPSFPSKQWHGNSVWWLPSWWSMLILTANKTYLNQRAYLESFAREGLISNKPPWHECGAVGP